MKINPQIFYGLSIPFLKSTSFSNQNGNSALKEMPIFLKNLIEDKNSKPLEKTAHQYVRELFYNTNFDKNAKNNLVLLINCFCGEKEGKIKAIIYY